MRYQLVDAGCAAIAQPYSWFDLYDRNRFPKSRSSIQVSDRAMVSTGPEPRYRLEFCFVSL